MANTKRTRKTKSSIRPSGKDPLFSLSDKQYMKHEDKRRIANQLHATGKSGWREMKKETTKKKTNRKSVSSKG